MLVFLVGAREGTDARDLEVRGSLGQGTEEGWFGVMGTNGLEGWLGAIVAGTWDGLLQTGDTITLLQTLVAEDGTGGDGGGHNGRGCKLDLGVGGEGGHCGLNVGVTGFLQSLKGHCFVPRHTAGNWVV